MAEVLVSTILDQLASLKTSLPDKEKVVLDVLTTKFQDIQVLLQDAETRQAKDENVRDWLDRLKDTSYDLEDVLDEWSTTARKIRDGNKSKPFSIKVCSSIPCNLSCHRQLDVIKVLSTKLDRMIATGKDKYNFSKTEDPEQEMATSSVVDLPESNIYERVQDRNKLVSLLLSNIYERVQDRNKLVSLLLTNSRQGPIFPIISIVGMRGSGKTKLAQQAFDNKEVGEHFQEKFWVRVSDLSDEISIAKKILKKLDAMTPNLDRLETLFELIRQSFQGIKFLLVLDDVCITGPKIWKEMRNLLKYNCQGSKILITIREEDNVKMVGNTSLISLGKFSDEECWSFVNKDGCLTSKSEENDKLEEIGKKIVCKCNGLPLTLNVLRGLLSTKKESKMWEKILDSNFLGLKDVEKGVFPSLFLSYYDLSTTLKKCFLCCAIFPKDYKIEKDTLIKLWMAQDYLKKEENDDLEKVGEECFQNLAMRSFFHDFEKSKYDDQVIISCKMPDLIHDFAQFLVKNECSIVEVDGLKEFQFKHSHKKVRHIKITDNSIPTSGFKKGKLLSLVKCGLNSKVGIGLSKIFEQLTCLRTLDLSGCSFEDFSGGIKNLIHLRYLNISQNKDIKELPGELCELYSLQTLNISNCENLKSLPPGIGKLTNLLHLINYGTPLSYVPKEVELLTCLRTLNKFAVSDEKDDKEACKLDVLANLIHLEGFLIITGLGNVSEGNEVNTANLGGKKNLVGLGLRFNGLTHVDDEKTFDGLESPPNLQELMVQYYIGKSMSLRQLKSMENLRVLKLSFCLEFEHLPALGELKFLQSLYVSNMKNVKCVGEEFFVEGNDGAGTLKGKGEESSVKGTGATSTSTSTSTGTGTGTGSGTVTGFPKLKFLKFVSMDGWEDWKDIRSMSCLESLTIGHCQKLKALPAKILDAKTLKELKMHNCSLLKAIYDKNTGTKWSTISRIPNITIDDDVVQKEST